MGPLPPPVTGMSLLTEKVVDGLRGHTSLAVSNFTAGDARPRRRTRILRLVRTIGCLVRLNAHGRVRNGRLYLTANSRSGLIMTGLIIKSAQRLGYTVYLHHHTYNYIDAYDRKMAWIDRNMRASDVYVVHCPQMTDDFRARYASKSQFECVFPSIVSMHLGAPRTEMPEALRLGFLANLMLSKGLDLVLETFRVLRHRGRNVELILAGPCSTVEAERLVRAAQAEFKDSMTYVGAVYGEAKERFFSSIDCFLFPSRTESWGIVLNESLASGIPVIATNRGCVHTLVGEHAGLIVDQEQSYVDDAVRQVESWIDSPETYFAASRAAIDQADYLHREASKQLDQLVANICAPETRDGSAPKRPEMLVRNIGMTDGFRFGVDRIADDRVSKFVGPQAEVEFNKSQAMKTALAGSRFSTPEPLGFDVASGRVEYEYIGGTTRLLDVIKKAHGDRDLMQVLELNRGAAELLAIVHRNLKLTSSVAWEPPPFLLDNLRREGIEWSDLEELPMHCDFSPVNLLVKTTGELVLIDASPNNYFTNRADLFGPRYVGIANYTSKLFWPFRLRTYAPAWRSMARVLRSEFLDTYERVANVTLNRKVLRVFERAVVRSFVLWKTELFLIRQPALMVSRIALPFAGLGAFVGEM